MEKASQRDRLMGSYSLLLFFTATDYIVRMSLVRAARRGEQRLASCNNRARVYPVALSSFLPSCSAMYFECMHISKCHCITPHCQPSLMATKDKSSGKCPARSWAQKRGPYLFAEMTQNRVTKMNQKWADESALFFHQSSIQFYSYFFDIFQHRTSIESSPGSRHSKRTTWISQKKSKLWTFVRIFFVILLPGLTALRPFRFRCPIFYPSMVTWEGEKGGLGPFTRE